MKALSIRQPWAALILERPTHIKYGVSKKGIKPVENRTRPWKHNGPLAIHASKKFDEDGLSWIMKNCIARDFKIAEGSRALVGGIVGTVEMTDCVSAHDSNYFFGPYGYVFENPKKCELIPYKGHQGIFNIDFNDLGMTEIREHFPDAYDCIKCGTLHIELPYDGLCKCGWQMLPF